MTDQEDMRWDFGDGTFSIVFPGEFTDDDGEVHQYGESIKIKAGNFAIKVSPYLLASILRTCQRPDVKEVLQARLTEQLETMREASF